MSLREGLQRASNYKRNSAIGCDRSFCCALNRWNKNLGNNKRLVIFSIFQQISRKRNSNSEKVCLNNRK